MTVIDTTMATTPARSGETNGRAWGLRATDWANIQEAQCAPAYHAVFDKAVVGSETRLLDAGCGAGMALYFAADLGARVSGIDASTALLEVARSRLPNAHLVHGDLEELPFEDNSFDVVSGFNSFQYAANPTTALKEARRVTRLGGRVFTMTWGAPETMEATALVAALKPLLPPAPPNANGPFALSVPGKLEELAASAGLTPVEVFDVDAPWSYPDLATAQKGLGSSGVAAKAAEVSGQEALDAAHAAALAPFRQPDGSYRIRATFRVLMAENHH
ncbi:class I SAM-dependent methyltransferase [Marivita hallyeonensis]|uniref:Methyltransferase domain-containing protein n=1 Tax=Marivita hallyeonensis TaxID=996342 RepID=A0A1M5R4W5_9RHOB|nr:class I SAM-dependent methyltransferase [Marivita hallyeonensis]SHH21080.1 Methyltransferase domain-containing protein [Marivita hallyeonensis]